MTRRDPQRFAAALLKRLETHSLAEISMGGDPQRFAAALLKPCSRKSVPSPPGW